MYVSSLLWLVAPLGFRACERDAFASVGGSRNEQVRVGFPDRGATSLRNLHPDVETLEPPVSLDLWTTGEKLGGIY